MKHLKKVFFKYRISHSCQESRAQSKENNYNTNEFHKLFEKSEIEIWKTIRLIHIATDEKSFKKKLA